MESGGEQFRTQYNHPRMHGDGLPRRGFLKKGLIGGALLLVGGAVPVALRSTRRGPSPQAPLRLFSADEHATFAAIATRVVPGDGAGHAWPSAQALDVAGRADAALADVHPEIGRDFRRLLRLFENGLFGLLMTGWSTPFSRLDGAQQDARLEAWRHSRLPVLRSGYQALVRLARAIYFASPETYALVGYPGPPVVPA